MRQYGLAIDPGLSSGLCLFSYGDEQDEYFKTEKFWQITGGALGLSQWAQANYFWASKSGPQLSTSDGPISIGALIVEKFTPRQNSGFALTQASVEPLRGEGVLIGIGMERYINYQQPASQYFMGGNDSSERKKRSREFLKENGLYLTGKQVGSPDADDAISAELHAIAFLRRIKHMPTLAEFFPEQA